MVDRYKLTVSDRHLIQCLPVTKCALPSAVLELMEF